MSNAPTRAGFLGQQPTGTTLVSVNGVEFGDPATEYTLPGMLYGRGLTVEGPVQQVTVNGLPLTLITVWLGSSMVTLTLNPSDQVVLGSNTTT